MTDSARATARRVPVAWHETTLVPFDVDRVVTACVATLTPTSTPPWQVDVDSWLIDPGVDIPEQATAVHGITTEHAKEHGQPPAEALDEIAARLALNAGAIVGMNLVFDLTLLDRELRRYRLPTLDQRARHIAPVIDVYVIDRAMDPYRRGRRLEDLCASYGMRRLDAVHDALAAARLAYRMGQLAQMDYDTLLALYADRRRPEEIVGAWQQLGRMTLIQLHQAQVGWRAEQMASFAEHRRRQGQPLEDEDGSWPLRPYRPPTARGEVPA